MKIKNPSWTPFIALAVGVSLIGCATTAPGQLVEARKAYENSSKGLAAKLTPTELYDAKKALDRADTEFAQRGDSLQCRDYAYIAQRKVELVDVKARTEQDRQKIAEAGKAGIVVRDMQVKDAQTNLASTRAQLRDERRDNAAQAKELESTASQLQTEKDARATAEQKLAGALKDLATVAAVREEARGLVITLSGSVLFASGKYALLNTAQTKLDQVADALKELDPTKRMIVEGHTDNRGTDAMNQSLSQNRATTVREYLVSKGVAGPKITSIGMGSNRPLTDNRTAENRANNRRVEIVIADAAIGAL